MTSGQTTGPKLTGIPQLLQTTAVRRLILLFLSAGLITLLNFVTLLEFFNYAPLEVGQIATRTVRAPRDLFIEDPIASETQKVQAEKLVRRVFEFDDSASPVRNKELGALFSAIDDFSSAPGGKEGTADLEPKEKEEISKSFGLNLTDGEWQLLSDRALWSDLQRTISSLVYPILHRGIIADKAPLESALHRTGATLVKRDSGTETFLLSDALIYDFDEAKQVLHELLPERGYHRGAEYDSLVSKLGSWLIKPNVRFDRERTEERLESARGQASKVYFQVRRGELVVRAGEKITPEHLLKLEHIRGTRSQENLARGAAGYFIFVTFTLGLLFFFAQRGFTRFKPKMSDTILLASTLITTVAVEKLGTLIGEALSFILTDVDPTAFSFLAPVAAGGVLLQLVLGPAYVAFYVIAYTTVFSVLEQDFSSKMAVFVIGSIVGSLVIKGAHRRSIFLLTGLRIALANVIVLSAYSIIFPQVGPSTAIAMILSGSIGGLGSGLLALGVLPIIEYFGGYVTAIKLLELASLDRPLLRELSIQAPGTWSHSMIMGQLGETAAEAIGAFPLLTRVGAYYHDVGKAKKPLYFAENQTGRENKHGKLAPSMSALIIRAHVKDGIEMGKAARLPQAVLDFIPQHHGTALIEFFYDKATKEAASGEIIDENLFRYPGPKPQTKEAGIIMLADSVEAVSRLMSDPSPAKIQGMVQKVINRVFASGQLDESELTLKDLHHIAKSFSRVLTGIVHRRIEYPDPVERPDKKELERRDPDKKDTDKKDTDKKDNVEKQRRDSERKHSEGGETLTLLAANEESRAELATTDIPVTPEKSNGAKTQKEQSDKGPAGENKETLRRLGI